MTHTKECEDAKKALVRARVRAYDARDKAWDESRNEAMNEARAEADNAHKKCEEESK